MRSDDHCRLGARSTELGLSASEFLDRSKALIPLLGKDLYRYCWGAGTQLTAAGTGDGAGCAKLAAESKPQRRKAADVDSSAPRGGHPAR